MFCFYLIYIIRNDEPMRLKIKNMKMRMEREEQQIIQGMQKRQTIRISTPELP